MSAAEYSSDGLPFRRHKRAATHPLTLRERGRCPARPRPCPVLYFPGSAYGRLGLPELPSPFGRSLPYSRLPAGTFDRSCPQETGLGVQGDPCERISPSHPCF